MSSDAFSKKNEIQLNHQKKWFNSHYSKFSSYDLERWRISILSRLFLSLNISGNEKQENLYLDIGVGGSGYTVIEAAKSSQKSVGIDLSFEGVKKARDFSTKEKLKAKCFFVVCSADALPFKTEIFDKISAISVLEHLHNDSGCVNEIYRITNKKGKIYITVPNTYYRMWPFLWPIYYYLDKQIGHLRHYSEEKLIKMFTKKNLSLMDVFYNGHLIKLAQLMLEKIIGTKNFSDSLWWKLEDIDTNSKVKTGLQLTTVFEKL